MTSTHRLFDNCLVNVALTNHKSCVILINSNYWYLLVITKTLQGGCCMEKIAPQVERKGYTTKELAYLLNISKATIYRLVKAGKLHPILFGTKLIFLKDDIDHFIKEEQANRKPRQSYVKKTKAAT